MGIGRNHRLFLAMAFAAAALFFPPAETSAREGARAVPAFSKIPSNTAIDPHKFPDRTGLPLSADPRRDGHGIVPVTAQLPGAPKPGTGTGIVFSDVGANLAKPYGHEIRKTFVLTSSHVSQGDGLEIGGCDKPPRGRLANNDCDIEIIEVDNSCGPPAAFVDKNSSEILFYSDRLESWSGTKFPWTGGISDSYVLMDGNEKTVALKAPWSATGSLGYRRTSGMVEAAKGTKLESWDRITKNPLTGEAHAPARVARGQSGTALLGVTGVPGVDLHYNLKGIVVGYQTEHDASTFVCGEEEIRELYRRYRSGERGRTNGTRWIFSDGIATRNFAPGVNEIPSLSVRTHGNQTGGRPGNQSSGRPGNQTSSPPGNQSSGRPDGNQTKAPPGNQASGRPSDADEAHSLLPSGAEWAGKHVLGLRFGKGTNVYADTPALIFGLRAMNEPACEGVAGIQKAKADFFALLREKAIPHLNALGKFNEELAVLSEEPYVLSVAGAKSAKSPQVSVDSATIAFEVFGPAPARERLAFEMDQMGNLRDSLGGGDWIPFRPELKLKGASGAEFLVDLSSFFFVNPNLVQADPKNPSRETAHVCGLIAKQGREGAILRVYDRKTGAVVETRFDKAEGIELSPHGVWGELDQQCRDYLLTRASQIQEFLELLLKGIKK